MIKDDKYICIKDIAIYSYKNQIKVNDILEFIRIKDISSNYPYFLSLKGREYNLSLSEINEYLLNLEEFRNKRLVKILESH